MQSGLGWAPLRGVTKYVCGPNLVLCFNTWVSSGDPILTPNQANYGRGCRKHSLLPRSRDMGMGKSSVTHERLPHLVWRANRIATSTFWRRLPYSGSDIKSRSCFESNSVHEVSVPYLRRPNLRLSPLDASGRSRKISTSRRYVNPAGGYRRVRSDAE